MPDRLGVYSSLAVMVLLCSSSEALLAEELQSPVDPGAELQVVRADFGLADGPAWDGRGSLYVPDVRNQSILRYRPASDAWQTVLEGDVRYSASFFSHGRLYLSANSVGQVQRTSESPAAFKPGTWVDCHSEGDKPPRPNDLVVDHAGGVYYTLTPTNEVVYVDPDGKQTVLTDDIAAPNGIILSPDQRTLYVAAYREKTIQAVQLKEPGVAGSVSRFAAMDDGDAPGADGMSIDRAGNVYCAGATDVWIWSPDGDLLDRIPCPQRPINCAFGDPDMRTLYITGFGGLWKQRMRVSGCAPEPSHVVTGDSRRPSTVIPEELTARLNEVYSIRESRKLRTDLFIPDGTGPFPAVICVHGGGWLNGDKTKFRALGIELARRGYVTSVIEYRLGDEARFPAAIQDCFAAVRYLRQHSERLKVDADRIGVVGGSAGGHLAGLMATGAGHPSLLGPVEDDTVSSAVQAAIVMAGPMQIASGSVAERSRKNPGQSNAVRWIGGTIDDNEEAYHLADAYEKISGLTPPVLFMRGEHDNPQTDDVSIRRLQDAGVVAEQNIYSDGKHGCWNRLPWFTAMVDDMDAFFSLHLRK